MQQKAERNVSENGSEKRSLHTSDVGGGKENGEMGGGTRQI